VAETSTNESETLRFARALRAEIDREYYHADSGPVSEALLAVRDAIDRAMESALGVVRD